MKKTLAIVSMCLVLVMIVPLLSSCSNRKKFVGTWDELDSDGDIAYDGETLVFANDGTGSYEAPGGNYGSLTWSVEKNKVFITVSMCGMSNSQEFTYKFSGDTLILTDTEGEVTVYRKRDFK